MRFIRKQRVRVKDAVVDETYFEEDPRLLLSLLGEPGVISWLDLVSVELLMDNDAEYRMFHPDQIEPRLSKPRPKISNIVVNNGSITEE